MRHPFADDRGCRRLATAALLGCAALALVGLPRDAVAWQWQAALLAPGALIGVLRTPARRPFWRAALATALQLGACLLAQGAAGGMTRPAALAGTILPPLAFVAVRRQDGDAALGLFLSFCVLLVGTILGEPSTPLITAYVVTATVQLRCETHLRARREAAASALVRPRSSAGLQLATALGLSLSALLAAFAVERTLTFVPTPSTVRTAPTAAAAPRPRAGLADTFDLAGDGNTLDLRGERLVSVAMVDGDPVPEDLYLRSGFFQLADLDSWQVGPLAQERHDASAADYRLHLPLPGAPTRRLEITRLLGARNRVFVPPGTCSIQGVPDLMGDKAREWFRQTANSKIDVYEVTYQDLRRPPDSLPADPRWNRAGLLDLPRDLDRSLFEPLLAEFAPRGSALAKADAIAQGLQARCRYVLREPIGPHGHALLDFLHGERIGFCMHFASAAAILLRMSGVPCRIGVGLYGGTRGTGNTRDYGSRHSHAWVEIPITGRGWVTFDPTPPAERGARPEIGADTAGSSSPDEVASAPNWAERALSDLQRLLATPWPYAALLALLFLPLGRRPRTAGGQHPPDRALRPARRRLLKILAALAERGHLRPRGATIEQLVATLLRREACPPELRAAFAAYQDVRFGGRAWNPSHEERMALGLAAAQRLPPIAGGSEAAASEEA